MPLGKIEVDRNFSTVRVVAEFVEKLLHDSYHRKCVCVELETAKSIGHNCIFVDLFAFVIVSWKDLLHYTDMVTYTPHILIYGKCSTVR